MLPLRLLPDTVILLVSRVSVTSADELASAFAAEWVLGCRLVVSSAITKLLRDPHASAFTLLCKELPTRLLLNSFTLLVSLVCSTSTNGLACAFAAECVLSRHFSMSSGVADFLWDPHVPAFTLLRKVLPLRLPPISVPSRVLGVSLSSAEVVVAAESSTPFSCLTYSLLPFNGLLSDWDGLWTESFEWCTSWMFLFKDTVLLVVSFSNDENSVALSLAVPAFSKSVFTTPFSGKLS